MKASEIGSRILVVDNDPAVLRIYQDALMEDGFQVETVEDGAAAMEALRKGPPSLVVLDLLLPECAGVDVLKFMRTNSALRKVPVILLSNSFMNDLVVQAAAFGVHRTMHKMRCSPHDLIAAIHEALAGRHTAADAGASSAKPKAGAPISQVPWLPGASGTQASTTGQGRARFHARARRDFFTNAGKTRDELLHLAQSVARAGSDTEREVRLTDLYLRLRFLAVAAGMAEAFDIGLLASVFEALLFELISRPERFTPSIRRTLAFTTDYLAQMLDRLQESRANVPSHPRALVVDDEKLSNRLMTAALHRAHLDVQSTENPVEALQWAQEGRFDLVLLDIEMPDMDGFEFCRKLRKLAGYERTPVIYVTSHNDFEHRAKSVLSGANDLIGKPILPIEVAVKAVMHLLKTPGR
jgi:DNA-binding response OmpR family regulator